MENIKPLSLFFFTLCIVLLVINCKDPKGQKPGDDPKTETVERPAEVIEVAIARKQYLTYEKRRVELIQKYEDSLDGYYNKGQGDQNSNNEEAADPNDPNGKRFDVARYVSWDYETIKNYLKYIEKEAADANVEISTLRFYFSNYPADDKSAVHPRQNSIIITPTLNKNDREYIFSINDSDAENIKPQLLTNGFVPIGEKGMGYSNYDDGRSYATLLPEITEPTNTNPNTVAPFQSGRSVTMNKGNSSPPPHHQ